MLVVLVLCGLVPFPALNCLITCTNFEKFPRWRISSTSLLIHVEGRVSEVTKSVEILEASVWREVVHVAH
jgi:hypothetical protein